MGKRLVVVRHAKSSWDDPLLPDHDRPLAKRGRKALPRMSDHMRRVARDAQLVLCSSSRRTQATLGGIRQALRGDVHVEIDERLYGAGADELLDRVRIIDDEIGCVVVIGHNPGVTDLIDLLAGSDILDAFPTGAIAVLSFDGDWHALAAGGATLVSAWTPREGDIDRASHRRGGH